MGRGGWYTARPGCNVAPCYVLGTGRCCWVPQCKYIFRTSNSSMSRGATPANWKCLGRLGSCNITSNHQNPYWCRKGHPPFVTVPSLFPPQLLILLTLCWPSSKPNSETGLAEGSLLFNWVTLCLATWSRWWKSLCCKTRIHLDKDGYTQTCQMWGQLFSPCHLEY